MREAQTPKHNFQGRERPQFVRPLSRHKPAAFLSSLRGVAPALEELSLEMRPCGGAN